MQKKKQKTIIVSLRGKLWGGKGNVGDVGGDATGVLVGGNTTGVLVGGDATGILVGGDATGSAHYM